MAASRASLDICSSASASTKRSYSRPCGLRQTTATLRDGCEPTPMPRSIRASTRRFGASSRSIPRTSAFFARSMPRRWQTDPISNSSSISLMLTTIAASARVRTTKANKSGAALLKAVGGKVLLPILVAVAYVIAAKLGFTLAFTTKQVTAVWPPTGIALAALLLWGYRVWPGIWIGAFASNALSSEPLWTAAAIATGNTLAPVFGYFLLQRFGFDNALERVRDVLLLALFGAAIAMTVSATTGVIALVLAQIIPWSAFPSVWWVWWAGDAMGVLFVAAPLLAWITSLQRKERAEGGTFELSALAAGLLGASFVSFLSNVPLRFSVYPFIIWTALRFRQRETTTVIAVVSVLAITGLVLGAITAERRAARFDLQALLEETKRSAETLQAAFLPEHLPQRLGLTCDAHYIAAERETLIGGDWYDAFDLPDGRIAFSIGDVARPGLDAAVSAARLR